MLLRPRFYMIKTFRSYILGRKTSRRVKEGEIEINGGGRLGLHFSRRDPSFFGFLIFNDFDKSACKWSIFQLGNVLLAGGGGDL